MCNWCEYLDDWPDIERKIYGEIVVYAWRADPKMITMGRVLKRPEKGTDDEQT